MTDRMTEENKRLLTERDEALRLKDAAVKVVSDFETAWKELTIEIVNERRWKEAYRQIAIDLRAKWGGWMGFSLKERHQLGEKEVEDIAKRIVEEGK